MFFFAIGVIFNMAFVGSSAWRLSTGLISGIFLGVTWIFSLAQR